MISQIGWGIGGAPLLLAALELSSRWRFRRKDRYCVWAPNLRLELHPDPVVFPELERRVRIEINGEGERGHEPPKSVENLYRILTAGGSSVESTLLDQPTSWPGRLEHILNRAESLEALGAACVHVGNIGRSGTASAHLNVTFQKVLPQYRSLDATIVMVGGNDVWDWLRVGAPSEYRPSPVSITETCFLCPGRRFFWSPRRSALNLMRREAMLRWLKPIYVRQNTGRWMGRARLMRANAVEIRNSTGDPRQMLDHFGKNFRELLLQAKRYSRRVVVALQPWFGRQHYTPEEQAHLWSGGMGDPFRGDNISVYYSLEVCCRLMGLVNERAVEIADDLGSAYVDLMTAVSPSLENYYDFIHFTPAGARVVAEALARFFRVGKSAGAIAPLHPHAAQRLSC
ncbi:MAG: SGNH/GDSL hydrolase family protein [Syntrophobacteraceae bacterium]